MKTDDLIALLAADPRPGPSVWPGMLLAALTPVLVLGGGFVMLMGVRGDLGHAITSPVAMWKWVLPGLLMLAGLALARALTRPEGRPRAGWGVALGVAGLAAGLFAWRAAAVNTADWGAAILGQTHLICLASISGIGLGGLIGGFGLLRRGATTRPGLSGFAMGIAAGGAATLLYALHCNEDDPMFFVTWYGLAILMLGLIGAAAGRRVLRM